MATPSLGKRNTINRPDFFRLCQWVSENKDLIQQQQTYTAVVKMAHEGTQLVVAPSAIKQAMSTFGLKLVEPEPKQKPSAKDASANADISVVAGELVRLMTSLGITPSVNLASIADADGITTA